MRRSRSVLRASSCRSPLAIVAAIARAASGCAVSRSRRAAGRCRRTPPTRRVRSPSTTRSSRSARRSSPTSARSAMDRRGLGDGPDADPDHAEEMNLTNPKRADRNSDGVVFYKVLNGRRSPKMPAFKDELSTEQIWSVVAYAQSLARSSGRPDHASASARTLHVDEVGVGPIELGADVHEHHQRSPLRDQPALDEQRLELADLARRRQERRHSPQHRAGADHVAARRRGEHRRRRPQRGQQPRRVPGARHRDDRVGAAPSPPA